MMLLAADLRFLLVTEHVDIQQVSKDITYDAVYALISRADKYLRLYFRIRRPRIGVLALNPHAGEGGLLGREEKEVISPAVQQAKKRGITAEGPGPADSMIAKAALGAYDILVAMYHDQALIPLKLIVPFKGVNLTVGLPFIRTSPLHGTAFDSAGKDKADPRSMYEAIALTVRIWQGLASCSAGRAVRTRE
jgi:4-hydroxythreonine-4-phosphate dehydrogenase